MQQSLKFSKNLGKSYESMNDLRWMMKILLKLGGDNSYVTILSGAPMPTTAEWLDCDYLHSFLMCVNVLSQDFQFAIPPILRHWMLTCVKNLPIDVCKNPLKKEWSWAIIIQLFTCALTKRTPFCAKQDIKQSKEVCENERYSQSLCTNLHLLFNSIPIWFCEMAVICISPSDLQ